MVSYSEAQRNFVHRYMDYNEEIIGVRVQKVNGALVLAIDVEGPIPAWMPETFQGVAVVARGAQRAVLAYC